MDLATYDAAFDAFQNAAAALSGGDTKPILKFEKGDWYAGQDKEDIPAGTKLAADMMRVEWGWVRWHDGKPVERRMSLVASGQQPPSRDSLGHNDQALWRLDDLRRPVDPWQKAFEIPVREIDGDKREFLLVGSSKGFEGAVKGLFKQFGEGMRANAGKTPIIELRSDKYTNQRYGIVKVPHLPLVDWKAAEELETAKPKKVTKF